MLPVVVSLQSLRSLTLCFRHMFIFRVFLTLRKLTSMLRTLQRCHNPVLMSVMLSLTFVMVVLNSIAILVKVVVRIFRLFLMQ
ncbi:hypothetical protein ALO38_200127 [Pseudomonas coronafaciens pv. zizaniae]|nr:hypothetical protein ALO38_200127 [Pseudomonas coronafaciens pv. zizaniae]